MPVWSSRDMQYKKSGALPALAASANELSGNVRRGKACTCVCVAGQGGELSPRPSAHLEGHPCRGTATHVERAL